MTTTPLDTPVPIPLAAATARARSRRERPAARLHARIERGPDRRGEALDIFRTIFVRPALDFGHPIARFARHFRRGGDVPQPAPIGDARIGPVENRP
jgi:hypothetical protein